MMKYILAFFIFFVSVNTITAQNEYDDVSTEDEFVGFDKKKKNREQKDWIKNLRIGGNFGFAANSIGLRFELSPLIGYQVVEDRVEIGTGFIYEFYRQFNVGKETIIGTNNYARVYVWEGLFAQTRGIYVRDKVTLDSGQTGTFNGGNIFLGGGYAIEVGKNSAINIGIDVSIIENDLYPERIFRPFFNFQYGF